jgi:hypothetical protein
MFEVTNALAYQFDVTNELAYQGAELITAVEFYSISPGQLKPNPLKLII